MFFLPDTLKVTGSTFSTPKSYDEHPHQVKYGSPPPGGGMWCDFLSLIFLCEYEKALSQVNSVEVVLSLWNIPEKTIVIVWGFRLANKKLNAWNWKAEFEVKSIVSDVMIQWAAQWALYIWWNRTDSMTSNFWQNKCWPSDNLFISRSTRALRFINILQNNWSLKKITRLGLFMQCSHHVKYNRLLSFILHGTTSICVGRLQNEPLVVPYTTRNFLKIEHCQ